MGAPPWQLEAAVTPSLSCWPCPFPGGGIGRSHHPRLGALHGTAPSPEWRQEVPSRMPWAARDQAVVSFTGTALPGTRQPSPAASLALKRHLPEEQRPGPKQFLSEEKMAARFNTLSLENDHLYSTNGFPPGLGGERRWEHWLPEQRLPPAGGSEDAEGSRVVLEGEFSMADCSPLSLGELGPPGASLLLPPLLQCLNPATELVLWAPPSSPVPNSVHSLRLPSWALTTPLPGAAPRDGAVMGERD